MEQVKPEMQDGIQQKVCNSGDHMVTTWKKIELARRSNLASINTNCPVQNRHLSHNAEAKNLEHYDPDKLLHKADRGCIYFELRPSYAPYHACQELAIC